MKKKIVWLLCSALLLTILSACGGNDDAPKGRGNNVPTSVSSAVTAPVRSTTLAVTVANVSGYNFQELYVSPTGTNNWGEDHLGSTSILKNNGSYDITLARYDFENYDVLIIDEDGDEYEFKYVPLVDGCEMQIGFDENGVPGVVVVGADGTENYVSGTLNGSSGATGGGETGVVTRTVNLYSRYTIILLMTFMRCILASSMPAAIMTSMYCLKFFQLTAAPLLWARLQWETGRRQSGRCMLRM